MNIVVIPLSDDVLQGLAERGPFVGAFEKVEKEEPLNLEEFTPEERPDAVRGAVCAFYAYEQYLINEWNAGSPEHQNVHLRFRNPPSDSFINGAMILTELLDEFEAMLKDPVPHLPKVIIAVQEIVTGFAKHYQTMK